MAIIDWKTDGGRDLVTAYSAPEIVGQRAAVRRLLALQPGERVIDIGSGPGLLAAEMAAEVGANGSVLGVDINAYQRACAREQTAGLAQVSIVDGDANTLDGIAPGFDAAVSTQVLEYLDPVSRPLAAMARVLRPGGRALALATDWQTLVIHSDDDALTRRIATAWDGHLAHPFLPRTLGKKLTEAGLAVTAVEAYPIVATRLPAEGFVRHSPTGMARFAAAAGAVGEAEAAAWLAGLERLSEAGRFFYSLNRYLFLAVKPGG
ncbi:MAG: methyltransferase domain-containing protein [Alphaproteobacteria bacterium]